MRLRGHHLICLNFFRGEGYSEEFVENIRKAISEKEIDVVFGADDICSKCPYLKGGICNYSENAEEEVTELDQFAYRILDIYPNSKTNWDEIKRKLPKIMKRWKDFACKSCDWLEVCENNEEWLKY